MNLRGIYFQREGGRFYPKRELAAHVLGYVDIDEKGLGGIEYSLDDHIRSKPGKMLILADAHRRWYDSTDKAPDTGTSVVLTLDEKIQYIAEKELAQAIHDTQAKGGHRHRRESEHRRIAGRGQLADVQSQRRQGQRPESRMDRAASALYEPGSVFKIVTLSAAIDQGITNPDEVIDCQNGAIYIAGHRIRDHKAYGNLTVSQILAYSSDVGAIKLGLRLGAPKFYDYIRAFGFGQPTGVDLPGESRGMLRRLENWTPVSVGSISMGQEIGVTPLQMIAAVSAMANGGLIVRPHVVRAMRRGTQMVESAGTAASPRDPGDHRGDHAPHAGRRCARRHGKAGAPGWIYIGGKDRHGAEIRHRHRPLLRAQFNCLVRRLCADQHACGYDSGATGFTGWQA